MKLDSRKIRRWLKQVAAQLDGLDLVLENASTETLVIGASVFDIYQELGWIPPFRRKTGDLDLSVGLVTGPSEYLKVRDALTAQGYRNSDALHKYRYFSSKRMPGALSYIDLLAHPAGEGVSAAEAARAMGAGEGFAFDGFRFASLKTFEIVGRTSFPNPLGMWALKRASYLEDPLRRVKDLADIVELASGLVETGNHFDLEQLWNHLKTKPEAVQLKQMLSALASGESAQWDIHSARQELLSRNFSADEIDGILARRIAEVVDIWQ